MDKPTWDPHDGYSGTDLHDDYGEAWKYIEHLGARVQVLDAELFRESARGDLLNKRNGRLEHEMGMVKPGSAAKAFMEEEYERMKSKVAELEAMLGAGNLCAFQMVLEQGSESDMQMRSRETSYTKMSATRDGEEFHFYNTLPVLIADEGGLSVWRFYRKAGH